MPRTNRSFERLPSDVTAALHLVGSSIRTARLSRGMTAADLAERLAVTLPTLRNLETGKPGVSLATLISALWTFGLLDRLTSALDPANDPVGHALAAQRLPQRARRRDLRTELDAL